MGSSMFMRAWLVMPHPMPMFITRLTAGPGWQPRGYGAGVLTPSLVPSVLGTIPGTAAFITRATAGVGTVITAIGRGSAAITMLGRARASRVDSVEAGEGTPFPATAAGSVVAAILAVATWAAVSAAVSAAAAPVTWAVASTEASVVAAGVVDLAAVTVALATAADAANGIYVLPDALEEAIASSQ